MGNRLPHEELRSIKINNEFIHLEIRSHDIYSVYYYNRYFNRDYY